MEETPKTSIRELHQQINLSVGTTHKLLRKDLKVYPYRITAMQKLLPVDFSRRLELFNWFVNMKNRIGAKYENPHEFIEEPLQPQKIVV